MNMPEQPWTEEQLQSLLRYFGNHVVGIVLGYHPRGNDRASVANIEYACLTAFVAHIGESWFLVTAGHLVAEWLQPTGEIDIVRSALVDYVGENPTRMTPLPFAPHSQAIVHEWYRNHDVDYAFILLDGPMRDALTANGITPLQLNDSPPSYNDYYGFGLVGFPKEYCHGDENTAPREHVATIRPVLVPLNRDQSLPNPPNRPPTFVADIPSRGDQTSINGMSGGPILGYRMGTNGFTEVEPVAIQSQWNGDERIIGCPIHVALEDVRARLQARRDADD